jgi:hypothetical protein
MPAKSKPTTRGLTTEDENINQMLTDVQAQDTPAGRVHDGNSSSSNSVSTAGSNDGAPGKISTDLINAEVDR